MLRFHPRADDAAFAYNDSADGDFADVERALRTAQSFFHPKFLRGGIVVGLQSSVVRHAGSILRYARQAEFTPLAQDRLCHKERDKREATMRVIRVTDATAQA
jgi:hypothetical protein